MDKLHLVLLLLLLGNLLVQNEASDFPCIWRDCKPTDSRKCICCIATDECYTSNDECLENCHKTSDFPCIWRDCKLTDSRKCICCVANDECYTSNEECLAHCHKGIMSNP
ncbi:unnamed protein product [Musa acuminata subsp. burmannicoides]